METLWPSERIEAVIGLDPVLSFAFARLRPQLTLHCPGDCIQPGGTCIRLTILRLTVYRSRSSLLNLTSRRWERK